MDILLLLLVGKLGEPDLEMAWLAMLILLGFLRINDYRVKGPYSAEESHKRNW
jgi:hypothetical protein